MTLKKLKLLIHQKKEEKTGIKVSFTLERKITGNKYLKEDQRSIQQSYISWEWPTSMLILTLLSTYKETVQQKITL